MIVDAPNSAVALAVLEVARRRNKVLMSSGAGTTDFSGRLCAPAAELPRPLSESACPLVGK